MPRIANEAAKRAPRAYRYVVRYNDGFAPCFEAGYCTLACCKPKIRCTAAVGDWVFGFAPRSGGRPMLLYAMQIAEPLSFAQFAQDPRFQGRRDNIYRATESGYCWTRNRWNDHDDPALQRKDIAGRQVLVADRWWHFGPTGVDLSVMLDPAIAGRLWYRTQGHKFRGLAPGDLEAVVAFLDTQPEGQAEDLELADSECSRPRPSRCTKRPPPVHAHRPKAAPQPGRHVGGCHS
ncbi:hypothetical protein GAY28_10670 [Azospirillum brasilense]|nr:hypothetical protein [Azospirillum brasilense]